MDHLRHFYVCDMRISTDPDIVVKVRWYPAPPGAKVFPGEHCFGSSVWNTRFEFPQPGLGEVDLKRTHYKPFTPPGVTGQAPGSPLSWFVNGVPRSAIESDPPANRAYCVRPMVDQTAPVPVEVGGPGVFSPPTQLAQGGVEVWGATVQSPPGQLAQGGVEVRGATVQSPPSQLAGVGVEVLGLAGQNPPTQLTDGGVEVAGLAGQNPPAQLAAGGCEVGGEAGGGSGGIQIPPFKLTQAGIEVGGEAGGGSGGIQIPPFKLTQAGIEVGGDGVQEGVQIPDGGVEVGGDGIQGGIHLAAGGVEVSGEADQTLGGGGGSQAFAGCSDVPLTLYIHMTGGSGGCVGYEGVIPVTSAGGGGVQYTGSAVVNGKTIQGKIQESFSGFVQVDVWEISPGMGTAFLHVTGCDPFGSNTGGVTPDFCAGGLNLHVSESP